jgi:hypothetical protein
LESSECYPPPLKPDSQANFQALSTQLGDSCAAPILEPERSALIQEALADSQLQAVKAQLERRGLGMNADEAQAVRLTGGEQLVIPFGQDAHLVWTRTNGQTAAIGLVRQGNKTLNVGADGQERVVRFLSAQQAEKLLRKLREKSKFQEFEGKLAQKGKRVGKVRVLLDETNKLAIVGIAAEGSEKIAHQVRIKVKAGKDDEPEDDAEPAIQATACGQASGEAVPTGARMQPLRLDAGEGGAITTGSYTLIERDYGPQICTSQWGYDYLCTSTTPMLSLSLSRLAPTLALPPTFINQPVQASFVIWNYGGGRLTGTVSVPAPFSIVSGASFSLLPGQPQEVVVRFSSGTAGSFSRGIAISSNGGNATVTATAVAHKVSFSPASVDFGSGLLVLREQCDSMGGCGLRTEKVGLPIEKALTVKNEGTVSVSLTLSTAGPYKIVSVPPTLSPGQSAQVTLRFDPTESGSFTGTVQVGINGGQGSVTAPLVGTAHKIEIEPAELNFGLVFIGSSRARKLTVKNQGVTTVALTVSTGGPYSLESPSSFTLAPSQSRDVVVRFTPPNSSVFSSNIRLTAGSNAIDVPVVGRAMTREEYIQQAVIAYNAAVQQGGYGAMYVQDGNRGLALAGFPSLSADEVTGFLGMFDQLSSPEGGEIPPEVVQAIEILNAIGEPQIEEWLWALVLAERAGQFEQEYERLLPLGFDRVVQAFQLISRTSPEQVKVSLHQLIQEVAALEVSDFRSGMGIILERSSGIKEHIQTILERYYSSSPELWLKLFVVVIEANRIYSLIIDAAAQRYSGNERTEFMENIHAIVQYIDERVADDKHAYDLLMKLEDVVKRIKDFGSSEDKTLISALGISLRIYGWDLIDIKLKVRYRGQEYHIDLVLLKRGYWLGPDENGRYVNVLSLINFYGCGGQCDQIRLEAIRLFIGGELNAIMYNLDSLLRYYEADFGIVGLVITDQTAYTGANGLQGIFNEIALALIANGNPENVAIFLVWTDSTGQLWFTCFGKGCDQMTPSQRKREACRMAGKGPGCGAKEWIRKEAQELPPPPDDDKGPVQWTP